MYPQTSFGIQLEIEYIYIAIEYMIDDNNIDRIRMKKK